MTQEEALSKLLADLGYKRLNRTWARAEIVVGLAAFCAGLMLGVYGLCPTGANESLVFASFLLMLLGSYLAMAGNRSFLYQSQNELVAYLVRSLTQTDAQGK